MKTFLKIIGSALAVFFLSLCLVPVVSAQTALDEIKARLESEGISVVDYSSPEGQWGSLPTEWIRYLAKSYTGISDLATPLESFYSSLTDLRRQLGTAISEKSGLTDQAEIADKNDEIASLQEDIKNKEDEAKDAIGDLIGTPPKDLDKGEGINLIFKEVDFYFNYSKWGRLPTRLIGVLENANYLSLQDVVDINKGADNKTTALNVETALKTIPDLSSDDVRTITDSIAILSASGERQINEVARGIVNTMKNIIAGLAVVWIIYAGARMIFAQGEESVITEQKKALFYGIIGLVAILLIGRGIDFLYGPAGVVRTQLTADAGFSNEVYGLVTFLKAVIGIIAILFIIISAIRMMFAAGDESTITKQRTALLWVGVGLILIAIDQVVVKNLFIIPVENSDQIKSSNVTNLINTLGSVLQFALGFVGLIAFGVLIYGAASMVANYGDEEMVTRAKKIIKNALIGILVIISAYTIVATLVVFR